MSTIHKNSIEDYAFIKLL